MTIKVELSPETEARLAAEARSQGLPLEKVAERLLNEALTVLPRSRGLMNVEDFHRMLLTMSEGSERLPDLPSERFSREGFYKDGIDGGDALSR